MENLQISWDFKMVFSSSGKDKAICIVNIDFSSYSWL